LYVSSTRPAPQIGLLSSAARNARPPKPPRRSASATVRSTSRRSASRSISRRRNATSVPLLNGGRLASRQSSTSCQRRSIVVASITSSSEQPTYAWSTVASANWAGGTGGCPRRLSAYSRPSSSWNASSNKSWRCSRRNTNSFARRIRFTIVCSTGDSSTGGRHGGGRIAAPPFRMPRHYSRSAVPSIT
jgi:hypothetical protein